MSLFLLFGSTINNVTFWTFQQCTSSFDYLFVFLSRLSIYLPIQGLSLLRSLVMSGASEHQV